MQQQRQQSSDLPAVLTTGKRPKVRFPTRQIALDQNDRNAYVNLTIKELAVHLVFFAFFAAAFSDMFSHATFVFNREMSDLFIDASFVPDHNSDVPIKFYEIVTMEHFWKYFYYVLAQKLYEIPVDDVDGATKTFSENQFLFRPRVRQLRVKEGQCEIRNQFKGLFRECYAPYEIRYEDKESFGPKKGTPWTYSDSSVTQAVSYESQIAYYGAGGFYFDFPKKRSDARALIESLEYDTWLNRATRAVFVDIGIYNGNINVISLTKLLFEFPASGGIIPSSSFRTAKLYRYTIADTWFTLVCTLFTLGFIIYFTTEELFEMWYFRLDYFTVFWNIVDFGIVFLAWCSVGVGLWIHIKESSVEIGRSPGGSAFFEHAVTRHETLAQLIAFAFFLVCVKTVKYTDLNRPMTVMYLSVDRCFKIVVGYLAIMAIVVAAFAVLGYCTFGAQVKGFSTVNDSFLSALRILMRDFDFQTLQHLDQTFVTFFFVLFTCVVIFVLLAMLVAIVFHAYFDVDVEELLGGRKRYVSDVVMDFIEKTLMKIGFHKWAADHRANRLNRENDRITYQDVYKILKRCHLTDAEVEKILKKYNIDQEETLNEEKIRRVFKDLMKKSKTKTGATKHENENITPDGSDLEWLIKRVNLLENALDEVHNKCDIIIARFDAIRVEFPPNYAELTEENH